MTVTTADALAAATIAFRRARREFRADPTTDTLTADVAAGRVWQAAKVAHDDAEEAS